MRVHASERAQCLCICIAHSPQVWANTKAAPASALKDLNWDRPLDELSDMPFTGKFVNALLNGHGEEACNQTLCSSPLADWGYPMCCWTDGETRYKDRKELLQVQESNQLEGFEECVDQLYGSQTMKRTASYYMNIHFDKAQYAQYVL